MSVADPMKGGREGGRRDEKKDLTVLLWRECDEKEGQRSTAALDQ